MAEKNLTSLSNTEIAAFCSQMAMILKSGISGIEGISIMLEDAEKKEEKELLSTIYDKLAETGVLGLALEEAGVFPDYFLNMLQIGEQTGKLDEVMAALSDYYEKEASLAQTIRNAVTYPLIMILMMVVVILVLIMKVMPVFNQVFRQLGSEMTGLSQTVLLTGEFLNRYSVIFIILLAAIVLMFFYLFKTDRGQNSLRAFLGMFKGTRILSEKIAARRFASGMALTLSSGLTPEECLRLTSNLIEHKVFHDRLMKCEESVSSGEDLCESLLTNGIFSGIYAKMAAIGSRTGVMDEVMEKITSQYEDDIDSRISGIIAAIEPTLVIILSVIVGIILLSVMLPLVSIMAGL